MLDLSFILVIFGDFGGFLRKQHNPGEVNMRHLQITGQIIHFDHYQTCTDIHTGLTRLCI